MVKVNPAESFNILKYAKQNNLKLQNTIGLSDKSRLYIFSNKNRVDCFHLSKDKEILGAKGAMGSKETLMETIAGILDKIKRGTGI